MAERIGQHGDVPPATLAYGLLERRSGCDCTYQRGFDVIHHPIQVQRRPMALVVAHVAVFGGGAAGVVVQQVERRWPTEQLHGARAETAADAQAEGPDVEVFGGGQVGHVEVDDEAVGSGVHGSDGRHPVVAV